MRSCHAPVAALVAVLIALASAAASTAAAPIGPCESSRDFCVQEEIEIPGAPSGNPGGARPVGGSSSGGGGGTTGAGGGGGGGGTPGPVCTWTPDVVFASDGTPGGLPYNVGAAPTPDSVLVWERCGSEFTGNLRWSTPAAPVPASPGSPTPAPLLPDPTTLANTARVRLEGSLPDPEVASDPPVGTAAIVRSPVFVEVSNWTGVVTEEECDPTGLLCVTVTATPSLTWSPGEPGAGTVECPDGGTRYDPTGPAPELQAQGACAHAFTMRTGAHGRPHAWPGEVTVAWDLVWASSLGGGGTLPGVTRSTAFPRSVDEVQAVVTEVG